MVNIGCVSMFRLNLKKTARKKEKKHQNPGKPSSNIHLEQTGEQFNNSYVCQQSSWLFICNIPYLYLFVNMENLMVLSMMVICFSQISMWVGGKDQGSVELTLLSWDLRRLHLLHLVRCEWAGNWLIPTEQVCSVIESGHWSTAAGFENKTFCLLLFQWPSVVALRRSLSCSIW